MDSKKCQRMFLLLSLWAMVASLVLFTSWQKRLTVPQAQASNNTHVEDSNVNSLPSDIIGFGDGMSKSSVDTRKAVKEDEQKRQGFSSPLNPGRVQQDLASLSGSFSLRRRFLMWDHANETLMSTIGRDHVTAPEKYLIYRCDMERMSFCGGWADRVKGALLTYVIANLTGRVFKVEMLKPPCNLLRYVAPNLVNWSLPVSFYENVSKKDSWAISKVDSVRFLASIHRTNFTEMIEEKGAKYTYFKANLDYSDGLRKSKLYSSQLSWMANLSNAQILSTLYKRVFQLSKALKQRIGVFIQRTLPTARHRLVCAHVRMGANPTTPNDSVVRFHEASLAVIWKFLAKHSKTDEDKIFFMSDSENVVRLAKAQPFSHRMVDTGGPINHIDRSSSLNTEDRCAGLEKLLFDQHVLMQCDVLLISLSGVSRMAAYIRDSDDGLYCLLKKGNIVPCKPGNIRKLYRIMG